MVADVLNELAKFDKGLGGLDPKKLAFRIYRDVRFSKDKSPYKINMGAGFSPNGKLVKEPGYYIHLQPGKNNSWNISIVVKGRRVKKIKSIQASEEHLAALCEQARSERKAASLQTVFGREVLKHRFGRIKTADALIGT